MGSSPLGELIQFGVREAAQDDPLVYVAEPGKLFEQIQAGRVRELLVAEEQVESSVMFSASLARLVCAHSLRDADMARLIEQHLDGHQLKGMVFDHQDFQSDGAITLDGWHLVGLPAIATGWPGPEASS